MDFYQSMTTKQRPCIYHTSQAILRITEYGLVPLSWKWSYLVQRSFHKSTSVEGELPPSMFLIDALLRHNIYPLQHWTQRRGVLLEALFKISEGYFFGPHHLIMAALLYFEEKVHKKKLRELMPFHFFFHGCLPDSGASGVSIRSSVGAQAYLPRDPDRISEQPCSGDGSYSSMPGADVDHPGSAHCHLEAAPASLGLPSAAEHLSPTTAVPHSQATEPQAPPEELLKRQSHLPKPSAPAPSTHLII
ncbi:hypothetical protein CK203_046090 [Vitis vinifera]|uniref:Uncharacterized protein n=1 Tax=Vitis vinifera TaxID=29760 RepID=A0A438HNX2_VITVI|nr:hypothetical protein CK203_046090 [Vitis vinifera]